MQNLVLNNRRAYLSWSQKWLFENRPADYKKQYLYGESCYVTPEMRFGKRFAEGLEKDKTDDFEIETARALLPRYPKKEYRLDTEIGGLKMVSIPDLFDPYRKRIGEVKTGKLWTQSRANNHGQLKFYNLATYTKYGAMAKEIELYWFKTMKVKGKILLEGQVRVFKVEHTLADLMAFLGECKIAYRGIQKMWEDEIKKQQQQHGDKKVQHMFTRNVC